MPIMNEHPYQDDFRKALSNYAPQFNSPNEVPPTETTETTVNHIQFRNHMEAPVAEAIAQMVVSTTLTRTIDPYTDPYEQGNGFPVPVRPSTIN